MTEKCFLILAWNQTSQEQVKSACLLVYLVGHAAPPTGRFHSPCCCLTGRALCTHGAGDCNNKIGIE